MEDWDDYFSVYENDDMLTKMRNQFLSCQKPSFAEKEYNIAIEKYNIAMMKYKNLNWFIRLFKKPPVKPIVDWFVVY